MICRMTKRPDRRGQVLFINAVNEVERKNAQSYLEDRHIARIAAAYDSYTDDGDFAKVATIQDIADNNFSLSIPLYLGRSKFSKKGTFWYQRFVQTCKTLL